MSVIGDWILYLDRIDVLDVVVPFVIIFAIIFSILDKTKILGVKSKNYNIAIAVAMSFASIVPHVTGRGPDIVTIVNNAFPSISLTLVASLSALIVLGMFYKDGIYIAGKPLEGWVVIFSIIVVIYSFVAGAGLLGRPPAWLGWILDPQIRSTLIAIGTFGLVIWFITKDDTVDPNKEKRRQARIWGYSPSINAEEYKKKIAGLMKPPGNNGAAE